MFELMSSVILEIKLYIFIIPSYTDSFLAQVDELMASIQKVDIEIQSLSTCAFKKEVFEEILSRIQKSVDELNLHSYSNLNAWVKTLDNQVRNFLSTLKGSLA